VLSAGCQGHRSCLIGCCSTNWLMFFVFQSEPETASSGCVVSAQFSHLHSVPGKKLQLLEGVAITQL
jgi:hypothetical protein